MNHRHRAYLDWASAAPVHRRAERALARALHSFGNPSSPHTEGRAAREALEAARTAIARLAGVKQRAVVFTSGATEANALAIQGRVKRCQQDGIAYDAMHILYLPTMHSSALKTIEELVNLGVRAEALRLRDGGIDLDAFKAQLTPQTILVCADAVCGETGTRLDTLRLRRVIDAAEAPKALLHMDASQLPLIEPIEHTRLGADFLTLDAQKVGGVRGIGALIVPHQNGIRAIMQGGGQEGGLRPGTEAVALAAAFAAALLECDRTHAAFSARATRARAELQAALMRSYPDLVLNEGKRQAPHILNISLPGLDTDYAVALLDTEGIAVSTRSACETDSTEGSPVVFVLTGDRARAEATLRISWGPQTPRRELRRFAKAFARTTAFLSAH